jgi:hypothetical protein
MSTRRLQVSLKTAPAMTVRRVALEHERLVYVICADRKLRYTNGLYSHIAYIGTTKKGLARVAGSAAYRAEDILWSHGVQSFDIRLVTCRGRNGIRSWCRLERAMIIAFREMFGEIPLCNTQGSGFEEDREFVTFRRSRIDQVIRDLSNHGAKSERTAITDTIADVEEG